MISSWPETPFEESMLNGDKIIIHCPDEDLVRELFDIFVHNGIEWCSGASMTRTNWGDYSENTCYYVREGRKLSYCGINFYSNGEYDDCIRCTFYGEQPDSDSIDETEWMSILGCH